MRDSARPRAERPRLAGLPALRAEERFVAALAETLAERVAARLGSERGEEGFLDAAAAARHLATTRRRIHELTSARLLRPDGRDGRRPLYRRASLDRYAEAQGGDDGR